MNPAGEGTRRASPATPLLEAIRVAGELAAELKIGRRARAVECYEQLLKLVGLERAGVWMLPTCVVDACKRAGIHEGQTMRIGFVAAAEVWT